MPNWCANSLVITGERADIFVDIAKAELQLSDDEDAEIILSAGHGEMHFRTPWSPPQKWLEEKAKKFPDLKLELKYSEPQIRFYGKAVLENGEIVEEDCTFEQERY